MTQKNPYEIPYLKEYVTPSRVMLCVSCNIESYDRDENVYDWSNN